jgi:hypothetical protein
MLTAWVGHLQSYGVGVDEKDGEGGIDAAVSWRLARIALDAAAVVQEAGMVSITGPEGALLPRVSPILDKCKCVNDGLLHVSKFWRAATINLQELGRIASHFYISHMSIPSFLEGTKKRLGLGKCLLLAAAGHDFGGITLRQEERDELRKLEGNVCVFLDWDWGERGGEGDEVARRGGESKLVVMDGGCSGVGKEGGGDVEEGGGAVPGEKAERETSAWKIAVLLQVNLAQILKASSLGSWL